MCAVFHKLAAAEDVKGRSWHGRVTDHTSPVRKQRCARIALHETQEHGKCKVRTNRCNRKPRNGRTTDEKSVFYFYINDLLPVCGGSVQSVLSKSRTWQRAQEGVDKVSLCRCRIGAVFANVQSVFLSQRYLPFAQFRLTPRSFTPLSRRFTRKMYETGEHGCAIIPFLSRYVQRLLQP